MTAQAPADVVLDAIKAADAEFAAPISDYRYRTLCAAMVAAAPALDREALAAAYIAGAMSVHEYWAENSGEAPRGDPEFDEAAGDWAYAALSGSSEGKGPLQAEGRPSVPTEQPADASGIWRETADASGYTPTTVRSYSMPNATTPASQPDFSDLRALAEKAECDSPSPWSLQGRARGPFGNEAGFVKDRDGVWVATGDTSDVDAYIAAANPARILALLDALEGRG